MDEFKCSVVDLCRDYRTGKARVTIETDSNILAQVEEIQDKDLSCKLSMYHQKRSLNANSYMWVLVGKLEKELSKNDEKVTKDLIYQSYIKNYGRSVEYQIPDEAIKAMTAVWNAYGLGWFAEVVDDGNQPDTKIVRYYYGSSCYSRNRMSRLIKAVVADCDALGIQTMTPRELQTLIDRWGDNGKINNSEQ